MAASDTGLYTARAVSRDDAVSVEGATPDRLAVHSPGELGGPDGGWNPERLYAAALATCLHQSLVLVSSSAGVDTADASVRAEVTLRTDDGGAYHLDAALRVDLPGADPGARERLVGLAAAHCPMVDESQVTAS
ncbi:OsmC family protein [Actinosynnema sp. NPDC053489]|uniref:OsmC family protein n=1 Tax=Actinosynnema sp. NPDC053489 TaxID=3363916 RepID=UPI0037C856A2